MKFSIHERPTGVNMIRTLFFLLLVGPSLALADIEAKDVAEQVAKAKAGQLVRINDTYPKENTQIVRWQVGTIAYVADLKAKLCFVHSIAGSAEGIAVVPCKALKEGYPIIAPLLP